jgi:hypothetical protein
VDRYRPTPSGRSNAADATQWSLAGGQTLVGMSYGALT